MLYEYIDAWVAMCYGRYISSEAGHTVTAAQGLLAGTCLCRWATHVGGVVSAGPSGSSSCWVGGDGLLDGCTSRAIAVHAVAGRSIGGAKWNDTTTRCVGAVGSGRI